MNFQKYVLNTLNKNGVDVSEIIEIKNIQIIADSANSPKLKLTFECFNSEDTIILNPLSVNDIEDIKSGSFLTNDCVDNINYFFKSENRKSILNKLMDE